MRERHRGAHEGRERDGYRNGDGSMTYARIDEGRERIGFHGGRVAPRLLVERVSPDGREVSHGVIELEGSAMRYTITAQGGHRESGRVPVREAAELLDLPSLLVRSYINEARQYAPERVSGREHSRRHVALALLIAATAGFLGLPRAHPVSGQLIASPAGTVLGIVAASVGMLLLWRLSARAAPAE